MESLVRSAIEKDENRKAALKKKIREEQDKTLESVLEAHTTVIKVVGTGGAGNNTLTRLVETGVDKVNTIAVNTDAQDLLFSHADEKLLIGKNITSGLGAGGDPVIGEESAKESVEDLKASLEKSDMVFITCGLGGGTGTGSAPIIAGVAQSTGALTIAIVTLPFAEEGVLRLQIAKEGLEKLKKNTDTVIVVQNDKLLEIVPDLPLNEAFKVADAILANAVKGIIELVTEKGLINLDFADIRAIMKNGGTAMIGLGESNSGERALEAVERAIKNPLLDMDIIGAKSALINISGGPDMSLKDAKMVMKSVAEKLDPSAKVIWGARVDEKLKNTLRVMLIATGLKTKDEELTANRKKTSKNAKPTEEVTFDINEKKKSAAPKSTKKIEEKEEKKARKVFSEILRDEAEDDLKVFQDGVRILTTNHSDRRAWQNIKNACSSLAGTAQMFDFAELSAMMAAMEDVAETVIAKEISVPANFVKILSEIPQLIRKIIENNTEDDQKAKVQMENFQIFKSYLQEKPDLTVMDIEKAVDEIWAEEENEEGDSSKIIEAINSGGAQENGDGKASDRPSVSAAVKYVDNLFNKMIPDKDRPL